MLTPAIHQDLARQLHQAEQSRTQILAPSLQHPEITIEDAYAVQKAWVAIKLAEGQKIVGHKIGLTSRAMQMSSQINEPDFGTLLDEMVYQDASDIDCARFIDPMVEVELAFILKDRLEGEQVTIFDVLSATDYVVPAVEIIDARCHRIDPLILHRQIHDDGPRSAAHLTTGFFYLPHRPLQFPHQLAQLDRHPVDGASQFSQLILPRYR